jgi:hypothetical protein
MKIKKTDEEVTFIKKVVKHTFDINGKEVRVIEESYYSPYDTEDYDTNIHEEDYEKLNELEQEAMGEELNDLVKLEVGGELETVDYENI